MKRLALIIAAFLFAQAVAALPAPAASSDSAIAAVVGEEAISAYDVESRLRFIIATTSLSQTPDAALRIRPQVLRSLIDEKLQLQAAAGNGIAISDQEVAASIAEIEKDRLMPPGAVLALMEKNRIPKETFTGQVRAQLAWRKLVLKKIRPQVRISDEEMQLAQQIPLPPVPRELKIATLTLPVDSPKREDEVRRAAEKLAGEILAGASFEEVARQFSGKAEPFWVRLEQLDPVLARALAAGRAGLITPALRAGGGYAIVKVYEVRAEESAAPPAPDRLRAQLFQQKIELEAQKYLRNLRRDTFMDIRE